MASKSKFDTLTPAQQKKLIANYGHVRQYTDKLGRPMTMLSSAASSFNGIIRNLKGARALVTHTRASLPLLADAARAIDAVIADVKKKASEDYGLVFPPEKSGYTFKHGKYRCLWCKGTEENHKGDCYVTPPNS